MQEHLKNRLGAAAFAFRGYNTTNLGRTKELLARQSYAPVIERHLAKASAICSGLLARRVDLAERVRNDQESTLETFGQDIGLIIAVELAQIEILERQFDIGYGRARVGLGYSLGEITALICGGVLTIEEVLPPLVSLASDCVELARDVTMGVLFSRGPELDLDAVGRLCVEITTQGRGMIAVSSHLSPNTVLLLGQGDTIDRFKRRLGDVFSGHAHLRKNSDLWPPLHTPLLWQRNIPNRGGILMNSMPGGMVAPDPPVLSLVTGDTSYNDYNCRELLTRWLDQPQKLWEAISELLSSGIEVILHVGPDPNLIPATFKRLSDNVAAQLKGTSLNSLGLRAMSGIASRPWLAKLLSARASLLRAPFLEHVIVEDWLLAQEVP